MRSFRVSRSSRAVSGGGPGVEKTGDKYTINVDAAEVGQVAKLILGDTLGYSYVVDPRVQGTITLSTGRPLAEDEVLRRSRRHCA